MKFEEFFEEINKIRAGMALLFCSIVIFVGLNPVPLNVSTIAGMKQIGSTFEEQITTPPKESDDPLVKEIRRRFLGAIEELDDEGLFG